jgi:hypothetical protein
MLVLMLRNEGKSNPALKNKSNRPLPKLKLLGEQTVSDQGFKRRASPV